MAAETAEKPTRVTAAAVGVTALEHIQGLIAQLARFDPEAAKAAEESMPDLIADAAAKAAPAQTPVPLLVSQAIDAWRKAQEELAVTCQPLDSLVKLLADSGALLHGVRTGERKLDESVAAAIEAAGPAARSLLGFRGNPGKVNKAAARMQSEAKAAICAVNVHGDDAGVLSYRVHPVSDRRPAGVYGEAVGLTKMPYGGNTGTGTGGGRPQATSIFQVVERTGVDRKALEAHLIERAADQGTKTMSSIITGFVFAATGLEEVPGSFDGYSVMRGLLEKRGWSFDSKAKLWRKPAEAAA